MQFFISRSNFVRIGKKKFVLKKLDISAETIKIAVKLAELHKADHANFRKEIDNLSTEERKSVRNYYSNLIDYL